MTSLNKLKERESNVQKHTMLIINKQQTQIYTFKTKQTYQHSNDVNYIRVHFNQQRNNDKGHVTKNQMHGTLYRTKFRIIASKFKPNI